MIFLLVLRDWEFLFLLWCRRDLFGGGGGSALVGVFLCSIGQFCCWVTMSGNIFLILLAYILLGVLYFTRCFVLWSISSSLSAILLCG